jgi:hypothetical protein
MTVALSKGEFLSIWIEKNDGCKLIQTKKRFSVSFQKFEVKNCQTTWS